MKRGIKRGILILAAAVMAFAPMTASAGIRGGVVVLGPGFYGPGWYNPFWGAYWGPGPYYAYPNAGEVKLDTKVKDAQVFINGSYAGTTKEPSRCMWPLVRRSTFVQSSKQFGCAARRGASCVRR